MSNSPNNSGFDDKMGVSEDDGDSELEFYGGMWMSAFPLFFFIIWAIIQTAILGVSDINGLVIALLIGLIVGMFFMKGLRANYASALLDGMSKPVASAAVAAWLWAGMFAATVQQGEFVQGLIWAASNFGIGSLLFPSITFVLAAIFSTGVGTGFGTVVAFTAVFFPAGLILGVNPVLMFAAILSGGAFGDNLAPVSDTTIVSAVTQNTDIGGVVASRFKYAIAAAIPAFILYIVFSSFMPGPGINESAQEIFIQNSDPVGLVHLLSMAIVIYTAARGRHIVEAISLGIIAAFVFNVAFGLAPVSEMILIEVPEGSGFGTSLSFLPFIDVASSGGVSGSLYSGATGFFPVIVLMLLILSATEILTRGGGFAALLDWSLNRVATSVRGAELTMVVGTMGINSVFTINTASEIAIAPYISQIGERYNIHSYRRANILDGATSGIAYLFPWAGAMLGGITVMRSEILSQYNWFTESMIVNPAAVGPFVFHCWLLLLVFIIAAWTGFGREYVIDRESKEVSRV